MCEAGSQRRGRFSPTLMRVPLLWGRTRGPSCLAPAREACSGPPQAPPSFPSPLEGGELERREKRPEEKRKSGREQYGGGGQPREGGPGGAAWRAPDCRRERGSGQTHLEPVQTLREPGQSPNFSEFPSSREGRMPSPVLTWTMEARDQRPLGAGPRPWGRSERPSSACASLSWTVLSLKVTETLRAHKMFLPLS